MSQYIQRSDFVYVQEHFLVTLKYGEEKEVHFMRDLGGAFYAHILPIDLSTERKSFKTILEPKIFQSGWISNDCVACMTTGVKKIFEKNLPNMKISKIDTDGSIYVYTPMFA